MDATLFDILIWIGILYVAVFAIEFFLGLIVLAVFVAIAAVAVAVGLVSIEQYPQLLPAMLGVVGVYAVVKVVLYLVGGRTSDTTEE